MSAWINPYSPVETAADLPAFCGKCGRAMRDDTQKVGNDRATGKPRMVAAVRCPKGRNGSGHEAFVVSPRPTVS